MELPTEQYQQQQHHQRHPTCYHYRHLSGSRTSGSNSRTSRLKRSRSKMDDYISSSTDRTGANRNRSSEEAESGPVSPSNSLSQSSSVSIGSPPADFSISLLESPVALPHRFEGDGLDFRSPVNTEPQEVIDLTGSDDHEETAISHESTRPSRRLLQSARPATRPPRFSAPVINLEDDSPPHFSRTLPRPQSSRGNRDDPLRPQRRQPRPPAESSSSTDDNEVQILNWISIPQQELEQPQMRRNSRRGLFPSSWFLRRPADASAVPTDPRQHSSRQQQPVPSSRRPSEAHLPQRVRQHFGNIGTFSIGLPFDYSMPAFPLTSPWSAIIGSQEPAPAPRSRQQPAREALPPVREGFTRTPQEDDVLICPNCREELCTEGDENKKQVSVIKNCGHVYCGECAPKNRSKANARGTRSAAARSSGSSSRAERDISNGNSNEAENIPIKPITTCVVEGCGKKATARDIIHVFL